MATKHGWKSCSSCSSNHSAVGALKNTLKACWGEISEKIRACFMELNFWQIKMCSESKKRIYWKLTMHIFRGSPFVTPVKYFLLFLFICWVVWSPITSNGRNVWPWIRYLPTQMGKKKLSICKKKFFLNQNNFWSYETDKRMG